MEVKIMKKTFKKRAFISAIAMLIVSAIVLTSATYAWFSMAKQVTVDSMELNITSPEGIQISANTTNFTTKLTTANITGTDDTAAGKRFNAYEGNIIIFLRQ
jgi:beta-mannanase